MDTVSMHTGAGLLFQVCELRVIVPSDRERWDSLVHQFMQVES